MNEHSDDQDLEFLLNECKNKTVSLVSDCGTPGFCDPGANLVHLCRRHGVSVVPVPGASSLMAFLSVCGFRLDQFLFRGFLPANTEQRIIALKELQKEKTPIIIMDTPYRLTKTIKDLIEYFPQSVCVLGYKLTQEEEQIVQGSPKELESVFSGKKGEFMILITK